MFWVQGQFQITLPVGTTSVWGQWNFYTVPSGGKPATIVGGWKPFAAGYSGAGLPAPFLFQMNTQNLYVAVPPKAPGGTDYQYDVFWRYTPGHPLIVTSSSGPVTVSGP